MMRVIRALLGRSCREIAADAARERHRREHEIAMQAVRMKVDAMAEGADRMTETGRETEEAARLLLERLREDFPK